MPDDNSPASSRGRFGSTLSSADAINATESPVSSRRPRHSFTRTLSGLSSSRRQQKHSQSQDQDSQGQGSTLTSQDQTQTQSHRHEHEYKHEKGQGQGQAGQDKQARRNAAGRDSSAINTPREGQDKDSQDGRGSSRQASASGGGGSRPSSTASVTPAAPSSPSHSPRLVPLVTSRTTGTTDTSGTSTSTGSSASSTASASSSRRPSVRTSKDLSEEYRPQHATEPPPPAASSSHSSHRSHHHHNHHNHHHHHHHRPHIHRHHPTSQHPTSSLGYMGSHSTTVAALAAAATAVAAASPTGSSLPNYSMSTGSGDSTATDRAPADDQAERKISAASAPSLGDNPSKAAAASASSAAAGGVGLSSIDMETVAAVAATLQKMQRRQSRRAARVLQAAVSEIEGLSTTTSQRLDAAYGSILGRISTLQDTVLALRSLAAAARETNDRFTSEADALARHVDHQILELEGGDKADQSDKSDRAHKKKVTPDEQQARLVQLSERVRAGRQSIESLSERVEKVRARVDRWEHADKGWQERTRTRLRVLWVIILGVIVAGIAVYVVVTRDTGTAALLLGNDAVLPGAPALSDFSDVSDLSKLAAPSTVSKFQLTFPTHTKTKTAPDGELQHLFDEL